MAASKKGELMKKKLTAKNIAKMLDHSLLHPTLTEKELEAGCKLARQYDAASACVKPCHTKAAKKLLVGSDVLVCAVIGFPHGNSTQEIKVAETKQVMRDGATEVDMVINIAKALEGDWAYLEGEIKAVHDATKARKAALKVIFEVDYLKDEHVIKLCKICSKIGVEFVKTSTGYNYVKDDKGQLGYKGATPAVLKLMRKHSTARVQVKAAGACSTLDAVLRARDIGVTRVGTGQTAKIVEDARARFGSGKSEGCTCCCSGQDGNAY